MWIVRNLNNQRNNDEDKKSRGKSRGRAKRVKGIGAAIAKLMRRRGVIDIVERFQTQHALQEERETGSAVAVLGGTWPARAAFADPINQMLQKYKHKGNPNHEN